MTNEVQQCDRDEHEAVKEILAAFHYETFRAGVLTERDSWPLTDEEWRAVDQSIDSVAVGEHYEGWAVETIEKLERLSRERTEREIVQPLRDELALAASDNDILSTCLTVIRKAGKHIADARRQIEWLCANYETSKGQVSALEAFAHLTSFLDALTIKNPHPETKDELANRLIGEVKAEAQASEREKALQERVAALSAAVTIARDTFTRYEQLHREKNTSDGHAKADANGFLAKDMAQALAGGCDDVLE